MRIEFDEPCPLPADPVLAEVAVSLEATEDWGWVVDDRWRAVYVSEQVRRSMAGGLGHAACVIGEHLFSAGQHAAHTEARFGMADIDTWRTYFAAIGDHVLADTPGGRDELRRDIDPQLHDIVETLSPSPDVTVIAFSTAMGGLNVIRDVHGKLVRVRDSEGRLRGTALLTKPGVPANTLSVLAFQRDPEHLERMLELGAASRRASGLLFADLEGSSTLARGLSTRRYFGLVRHIVRATDQCIVDAGGLVGRHVGDGVVAFFPVDNLGSESAAARACVSAARDIRASLRDVAEQRGLAADDAVVRFGLHWGATVFMGSIITSARTEVTALGDEVNEAARIEACATGGRTLASKQLVERLDAGDAAALGIDLDDLAYTRLADLDTATDKARRDAPAIAVCDV